jgi:hypothetical protein
MRTPKETVTCCGGNQRPAVDLLSRPTLHAEKIVDVARIDFLDQHGDKDVCRIELGVDNHAVDETVARAQLVLDQQRQSLARLLRVERFLCDHRHRHVEILVRADCPFAFNAGVLGQID